MSAIRFKVAPASAGKLALYFSALFAVAPVGHAQSIQAQQNQPVGASGVTVMTRAMASPAERPPVIDGRDDDAIWKSATAITGFRVFDPKEDGDPSFPTEAKIGYDAENLYVFTRMFDPHPDSIVSLLSRRDVKTQSEQIKIMIDSYHDRRTGYEFGVNPAGVKRDYYTLRRLARGHHLGRGVGCGDAHRLVGLDRGISNPAQPDPLSTRGRAHVRPDDHARHRSHERALQLATLS